jgi:hypothetical protein
VTPGTNLGFAGGANTGLRDWLQRSGGSCCLIGSHDLHVEPDTLRRLVEASDANPGYGVLAPRFSSVGAVGAVLSPTDPARVGGPSIDGVVEHRWVAGACMLLRRDAIEAVGLFDERFGSYLEDVDLCLRMRDGGWAVGQVPQAVARGLGKSNSAARRLTYANRVLLQRKRGGRRAAMKSLGGLAVRGGRGRLAHAFSRTGDGSPETERANAQLEAIPLAIAGLRDFGRRSRPTPAHFEAARRGTRRDLNRPPIVDEAPRVS